MQKKKERGKSTMMAITKPFVAKRQYPCRDCGEMVEIGQFSRWNRKKGTESQTWHDDCEHPWQNPNGGEELPMLPQAGPSASGSDLAAAIAQAINPLIHARLDENKVQDMIDGMATAVLDEAKQEIADLEGRLEGLLKELNAQALDQLRPRVSTFELKAPNQEPIRIEKAHSLMPKLWYHATKRRNIYLWGDAGSGKSYAAQQLAEALGLPYSFVSLCVQSAASLLIGHTTASGGYVRTEFRERYEHGGIFCIDELDNGSPGLLNTLNSALENGHCAFPDGMVKRHPDFILVCTGNTAGRGGKGGFAHRQVMDSAFRDRFAYLNWNCDEVLEESIVMSINASPEAAQWLRWVRSVRAYALQNKLDCTATPRSAYKGAADLLAGFLTVEEIAESWVFRGLEQGIVDKVLANCPLPKGAK